MSLSDMEYTTIRGRPASATHQRAPLLPFNFPWRSLIWVPLWSLPGNFNLSYSREEECTRERWKMIQKGIGWPHGLCCYRETVMRWMRSSSKQSPLAIARTPFAHTTSHDSPDHDVPPFVLLLCCSIFPRFLHARTLDGWGAAPLMPVSQPVHGMSAGAHHMFILLSNTNWYLLNS